MSALGRTSERDCRTRTTNENCTASESWTRTKYIYDANGRRVRKTTASNGAVDFLYDLSGYEITELSSTGAWNRGEVYADGRHLATYKGGTTGTTYFNHADWLGTERVRTTVSGTVYETCASLPFGDALGCSAPDFSPLHFTGQERDAESGLDNFGARFNSSSLGRFMSPDPEDAGALEHHDDPQSWNGYAYGRNNPLDFTDPSGAVYCRPAGEGDPPGVTLVCDLTDSDYAKDQKKYDALGYRHYDYSGDPPKSQGQIGTFDFAGHWFVGLGEIMFNGNVKAGAKELVWAYGGNFALGGVIGLGFRGLAAVSGSVLQSASEAANAAAENVDSFQVPLKHLAGAAGRWAKFAQGVDAKDAIAGALTSPNATFRPNGADPSTFVVVTDLGKVVGSNGQTAVKAVVGFDGKLVTAYPVNIK